MIANFIVEQTQEQTISGFQYISMFDDLEDYFGIGLNESDIKQIENILWQRVEVADIEVEKDCFDIVLYTDYAPNYDPEEYKEENFY